MACLLVASAIGGLQAQEQTYRIVTTVESIVPMGMGRSRLVVANENIDSDAFTTGRETGKDSKSGKVKRGDAKINNFDETKLLNFYSGVGINFQNIASNDALVADKLNKLFAEGWEIAFVISGVESDAGKDDGKGIFITRYVLKKMN